MNQSAGICKARQALIVDDATEVLQASFAMLHGCTKTGVVAHVPGNNPVHMIVHRQESETGKQFRKDHLDHWHILNLEVETMMVSWARMVVESVDSFG